jgi:hypothetical protein
LADFRTRLLRPALDFFRQQSPEEQAYLAGLLDLLQADPQIDGLLKIRVTIPPVALSCYIDERFWLLYTVVDDRVINVLNIGLSEETITPWN